MDLQLLGKKAIVTGGSAEAISVSGGVNADMHY